MLAGLTPPVKHSGPGANTPPRHGPAMPGSACPRPLLDWASRCRSGCPDHRAATPDQRALVPDHRFAGPDHRSGRGRSPDRRPGSSLARSRPPLGSRAITGSVSGITDRASTTAALAAGDHWIGIPDHGSRFHDRRSGSGRSPDRYPGSPLALPRSPLWQRVITGSVSRITDRASTIAALATGDRRIDTLDHRSRFHDRRSDRGRSPDRRPGSPLALPRSPL
jgi:hypothetical protein